MTTLYKTASWVVLISLLIYGILNLSAIVSLPEASHAAELQRLRQVDTWVGGIAMVLALILEETLRSKVQVSAPLMSRYGFVALLVTIVVLPLLIHVVGSGNLSWQWTQALPALLCFAAAIVGAVSFFRRDRLFT